MAEYKVTCASLASDYKEAVSFNLKRSKAGVDCVRSTSQMFGHIQVSLRSLDLVMALMSGGWSSPRCQGAVLKVFCCFFDVCVCVISGV